MAENNAHAKRIKLAELMSSLGAGILGIGIGIFIASYANGLGLPVLVIGFVLHAWGMTEKHRMEKNTAAPAIWWSTALYWICWVGLLGLLAFAIFRRL